MRFGSCLLLFLGLFDLFQLLLDRVLRLLLLGRHCLVLLRFPFLDQLAFRFPFGGLTFVGFRGALFFDAGNAWDTGYDETLGSIGGGLRLNLGGAIVLRDDVGKRIEGNFTRLQSSWFNQFFFGWDF